MVSTFVFMQGKKNHVFQKKKDFYFKSLYFKTVMSDCIISSSDRQCSVLNISEISFTDSYRSIISSTRNVTCRHS